MNNCASCRYKVIPVDIEAHCYMFEAEPDSCMQYEPKSFVSSVRTGRTSHGTSNLSATPRVNVGTVGHVDHDSAHRTASQALRSLNYDIHLAAAAIAIACMSSIPHTFDIELQEPKDEVQLSNGPRKQGGKRKRNPDRWR